MQRETLLKELKKNPYFLAPMAGVTDSPFRSFMKEMGCGIVTTELVSAKSIQMQNPKSSELMHFDPIQKPVGIQIFGEEPKDFAGAAAIVENTGADFIDLNFGCPVSKIIKKGAGSAILKDLPRLRKILKSIREASTLPVSIKIRTGWDSQSKNAEQVLQIAAGEGIMWITIHGRTRAQAFSGEADWNYITQIAKNSSIPIIGNGDLTNAEQVLHLHIKSHCQGMMIGRGSLKNPWIFKQIRQLPIQKNYTQVLERLKYYLENFYNDRLFLLQYKKFCSWFSSGFQDSSLFRKNLFQHREKDDILSLIKNYFNSVQQMQKKNTAYDPSLMQGHG